MRKADTYFSNRLSQMFTLTGYRREELAQRVGVKVQTVYLWENGGKLPDVNQFREIAAFFGLPYSFFLDDSRGMPETWQIAARLGLSDGTVEKLMELVENGSGTVLDEIDEALFSMISAVNKAWEDGYDA